MLVDLPGTYSLSAYSPEELYVRKQLIDHTPDLVINVIDTSNLERNLYLTTQLIDMHIPIIVLIVFCIIGMMFVGGFWDSEAEGYGDLALAFGNTDASVGLPWGSIIALVFTFIYLLCRRVISFGDAAVCIVDGFGAMVPALLIPPSRSPSSSRRPRSAPMSSSPG